MNEPKRIVGIEKIKCPICLKGLPVIEIDSGKTSGKMDIDYHCTECDIWVKVTDVTQEEKAEMFNW